MYINLIKALTNNIKAEISERAYDGKFAVWQPNLTLHEDRSWTFFWQIVGVFSEKSEAEKLVVSIVRNS